MTLAGTQGSQEDLKQNAQHAGRDDQPGLAYVPRGTGQSYKSPIDRVTFIITGEETDGALFVAEATVPPGGGNPPHIHHHEEERFYLQQGTLTIQVGDRTLNASAGDFVQLPRGVVHSFKNSGNEDAKFLLISSPAGLERFFKEAFFPAEEWPDAMPPMNDAFMARVNAAAAKCGLEFLPPT
jgi:quercetin dioxygenase-like cupin family protein